MNLKRNVPIPVTKQEIHLSQKWITVTLRQHHHQPPVKQNPELLSNRALSNKKCPLKTARSLDSMRTLHVNIIRLLKSSWASFLSSSFHIIFAVMPKITLCESFELYNLLNQYSCVSRLAEINYLCLIGKRLDVVPWAKSYRFFVLMTLSYFDSG